MLNRLLELDLKQAGASSLVMNMLSGRCCCNPCQDNGSVLSLLAIFCSVNLRKTRLIPTQFTRDFITFERNRTCLRYSLWNVHESQNLQRQR